MNGSGEVRILSLGAGVQSSTLALMMKHGELDSVECAIFSDVKAEPRRVYDWLNWLETQLPFPVIRVTQADGLISDIETHVAGKKRFCSSPPLFTRGQCGNVGAIRRQCTRDFKLAPIRRTIRRIAAGRKVVQIIGISFDERQRCRVSDVNYIRNEYPLVQRCMTRQDCKRWMFKHFYSTPPRSACVFCPYKCDAEWRLLRDDDPEGWAEAVRMDNLMRKLPTMREETFVHRSLVPLSQVDLSSDEDRGQLTFQFDCEGMCGV